MLHAFRAHCNIKVKNIQTAQEQGELAGKAQPFSSANGFLMKCNFRSSISDLKNMRL